jgi:hypothetical protein
MAIKISSTEVIDNSRVLQNITGANGVCNNFHAAAVAITTVLNFALPVMSLTMSGPVTFTESNKLLGRSALLLLDTSPSAFTPTFSSNIKWQNGTTPTWGDYQYWQIALQCIDGTNVRGIALGFSATAPTETITLSGTTGSYNTTLVETQGVPAVASWTFKSNGTVFRTNIAGDPVIFNFLTEWCNVTPSQTYYLRCTVQSGSLDAGSDTANVWHALTADRFFAVVDYTAGVSPETVSMKIEIASDSGGSNILATGYYQATANQEP